MARVQDLPVEILNLIFQYLYIPKSGRDVASDPSEFPFNVARVCILWHDAVTSTPEYWRSIKVDLKDNPEPLLDAFSASENFLFSVSVFTTADDTTDEGAKLENQRALRIVQHLQPHAERCTSIDFNVTFASSLPSLTPFFARNPSELEEITFQYKIRDASNYYDKVEINFKPGPCYLEKLLLISVHGSAFTDLMRFGEERLATLKINEADNLLLCLYDVHFPTPSDDMVNKNYDFMDFIRLLHLFHPVNCLYLSRCSLAYRHHARSRTAGLYDFSNKLWYSLYFDDVSKDFLKEFFEIGKNYYTQETSFEKCPIPPLHDIPGTQLTLKKIPSANGPFTGDESLYNVISGWRINGSIFIDSCPAFDDEFIRWLAQDRDDGQCEARYISNIDVINCMNFTPSTLCQLISALNRPRSMHAINQDTRRTLTLSGRLPQLDRKIIEWFKNYSGDTRIRWMVEDDAVINTA